MAKMKYWNGTGWIIMDANDADTVDGAHAGTAANNVLKLDGNGKVPTGNLPTIPSGNLPAADTTNKGAVILSTSTSDTSTTKAATPSAVKAAYDLANGKLDSTATAAAATKLATARTINGVGFDGTANITIADSTKEPTITAGTTAQYYRGDKSWQTLNSAAVGLGSVSNYGIATQAEAQAGTSSAKYMTPLRTKEAIQALAPTPSTTSLTITDSGAYFTATHVEGALQEIGQTLNAMRGDLITSTNNILGA